MKRLLLTIFLISGIWSTAGAVNLRVKVGTATGDSCNDWYYTQGLNGAAHNPAANVTDYYVGMTGGFQRRSARCFPGLSIPQNATIDSAFLKSVWITTDSTIKPVVYVYGVKSDAMDTICDSLRWVSAYASRTTTADSMYDSLWARTTTVFAWARTWSVKGPLQELVNQPWWQSGDTAVFLTLPKSSTTGDRSFKSLNSSGGGDSLIVYYTAGGGGPSANGSIWRRLSVARRVQ